MTRVAVIAASSLTHIANGCVGFCYRTEMDWKEYCKDQAVVCELHAAESPAASAEDWLQMAADWREAALQDQPLAPPFPTVDGHPPANSLRRLG